MGVLGLAMGAHCGASAAPCCAHPHLFCGDHYLLAVSLVLATGESWVQLAGRLLALASGANLQQQVAERQAFGDWLVVQAALEVNIVWAAGGDRWPRAAGRQCREGAMLGSGECCGTGAVQQVLPRRA